MAMILILTCNNCLKTSAVQPGIEDVRFPRIETELVWGCVRCNTNHRWLIPHGRTVEDTAVESLRHSAAHQDSRTRENIFARTRGLPDAEKSKILFGELIWWWRKEAELQIEEAAAIAGISSRQWLRVEAGENVPHANNLEKIVHAVRGTMDHAFLVIGSNREWRQEFIKRVQKFQARIEEHSEFQKVPVGPVVHDPDVELALDFFRRTFPVEADENSFLFFAHAIHQAYWTKQLGGTITVDDNRAEIIPVVMSLADLFERCEGQKAKKRVVYGMARAAGLLMRKPAVAYFAQYFLQMSFSSIAREEETKRRIGTGWKQLTPLEKVILALFDLVDPKYQPRLIKACQKLSSTERRPEWWFIPES
jgi:transcriptional regulator with XRE-family HTH domain